MQVDRLSFWAACAICIACGGSLAWAQGPGGPPGGGFGGRGGFNPEDFFNRLDRNGNGQLDPDELQNSPMRRMFEAGGRDLSKPITKQEFTEMSNQAMQRFRGMGRGGGPGGPGGPSGPGGGPPAEGAAPSAPPPAGNPESDGGRRGRGRRGDREDRKNSDNDSKGGNPSTGGGGSGGTTPRKPGSKGSASAASRPRPRLSVDLPEQYASRDTNQDGQLGLYEWPKTDLATFKRLDLNGDGFVTPQELERSNRSTTTVAATTAAAGGGPAATPDSAATKSTSGEANSRPGSKPAERPAANPAETAFNLLDRDKDGAISEEEWQRSLTTKSRFERAGITVSFPLPKGDFVRQYPADPR